MQNYCIFVESEIIHLSSVCLFRMNSVTLAVIPIGICQHFKSNSRHKSIKIKLSVVVGHEEL